MDREFLDDAIHDLTLLDMGTITGLLEALEERLDRLVVVKMFVVAPAPTTSGSPTLSGTSQRPFRPCPRVGAFVPECTNLVRSRWPPPTGDCRRAPSGVPCIAAR